MRNDFIVHVGQSVIVRVPLTELCEQNPYSCEALKNTYGNARHYSSSGLLDSTHECNLDMEIPARVLGLESEVRELARCLMQDAIKQHMSGRNPNQRLAAAYARQYSLFPNPKMSLSAPQFD